MLNAILFLFVAFFVQRDVIPFLKRRQLWKRTYKQLGFVSDNNIRTSTRGPYTLCTTGLAPTEVTIRGPWTFPEGFSITHSKEWLRDQATFDELFVVTGSSEEQTVYLNAELRTFFLSIPTLSYQDGSLRFPFPDDIRSQSDIEQYLESAFALAEAFFAASKGNATTEERLAANARFDFDKTRRFNSLKVFLRDHQASPKARETARHLLSPVYEDSIRCLAASFLEEEGLSTMQEILSFGGNTSRLRIRALQHILTFAPEDDAKAAFLGFATRQLDLDEETDVNVLLLLASHTLSHTTSIELADTLTKHPSYRANNTFWKALQEHPPEELDTFFCALLVRPAFREETALYQWFRKHSTSPATTQALREAREHANSTRKQRRLIEQTLLQLTSHSAGQLSLSADNEQGELSLLDDHGQLSLDNTDADASGAKNEEAV